MGVGGLVALAWRIRTLGADESPRTCSYITSNRPQTRWNDRPTIVHSRVSAAAGITGGSMPARLHCSFHSCAFGPAAPAWRDERSSATRACHTWCKNLRS